MDFKRFAGDPDFVLSLARGLSVIEAFQDRPEGVTAADVAARTNLSRAAARRLLITLEMLGYASHSGSIYRLTTRTLRLGYSFLSSHSLPTLALPILEELSAELHESTSLSVLEDGEILYLARAAANRVMSVALSIGSRLPAFCTSMGRVLLAALPKEELKTYLEKLELKPLTGKTIRNKKRLLVEIEKVRKQGYALVDEELELGLRSIAVPVVTRSGRVVAAMNTGFHASRVDARQLVTRMLPVLQDAARRLSYTLG